MLSRTAVLVSFLLALAAKPPADLIKSAKSGPWSEAGTWEG